MWAIKVKFTMISMWRKPEQHKQPRTGKAVGMRTATAITEQPAGDNNNSLT